MKIIESEKKCPICGHKKVYANVASFNGRSIDLDGCPGVLPLSLVQECPQCHYVAHDIEKEPSDDIRKTVLSAEYRSAFENEDHNLIKLEKMYTLYGQDLLLLYWYKRNKGYQCDDELKTLIDIYEKQINDGGNDPDDLLRYIDLLRQGERFEEVAVIVDSIGDTGEDYYSKILKKEKELALVGDSGPHKASEVI